MDDPVHVELFQRITALNDRITAHLVHDEQWHADFNAALAANTEITAQVRDILASFRVMASVAKWIAAIGAAVAAVVAAWKGVTGSAG